MPAGPRPGDVTGHDMRAASLMGQLRTATPHPGHPSA